MAQKNNMQLRATEPTKYLSVACVDCGKKFTNNEDMLAHKEKIHGDGQYACGICQIGYKTPRLLEMHKEKEHELKCPEANCNKVFSNKADYARHRKNHTYNLVNQTTASDSNGIKIEHSQSEVEIPFVQIPLNFDSAFNVATSGPPAEEERHETDDTTNNDAQFKRRVPEEGASSASHSETSANEATEESASKKMKITGNFARCCTICRRMFLEEDRYNEHVAQHAKDAATNGASTKKPNSPTVSSTANVPLSGVSSPGSSSSATSANRFNSPKKLSTTQPITGANKVPVFMTKWVCRECNVQFSNALELQIHLNVHVQKMLPSDDVSEECSKIVKEMEAGGKRLKDLLKSHSTKKAATSTAAKATTPVNSPRKTSTSSSSGSSSTAQITTPSTKAVVEVIPASAFSTMTTASLSASPSTSASQARRPSTSSAAVVEPEVIDIDDDDEDDDDVQIEDIPGAQNQSTNVYYCNLGTENAECTERIACREKMKAHIREKHPENTKDFGASVTLKFRCDKCKQIFARKCAFLLHQMKHENRQPERCEICSRPFATLGALRKHHDQHIKQGQSSTPGTSAVPAATTPTPAVGVARQASVGCPLAAKKKEQLQQKQQQQAATVLASARTPSRSSEAPPLQPSASNGTPTPPAAQQCNLRNLQSPRKSLIAPPPMSLSQNAPTLQPSPQASSLLAPRQTDSNQFHTVTSQAVIQQQPLAGNRVIIQPTVTQNPMARPQMNQPTRTPLVQQPSAMLPHQGPPLRTSFQPQGSAPNQGVYRQTIPAQAVVPFRQPPTGPQASQSSFVVPPNVQLRMRSDGPVTATVPNYSAQQQGPQIQWQQQQAVQQMPVPQLTVPQMNSQPQGQASVQLQFYRFQQQQPVQQVTYMQTQQMIISQQQMQQQQIQQQQQQQIQQQQQQIQQQQMQQQQQQASYQAQQMMQQQMQQQQQLARSQLQQSSQQQAQQLQSRLQQGLPQIPHGVRLRLQPSAQQFLTQSSIRLGPVSSGHVAQSSAPSWSAPGALMHQSSNLQRPQQANSRPPQVSYSLQSMPPLSMPQQSMAQASMSQPVHNNNNYATSDGNQSQARPNEQPSNQAQQQQPSSSQLIIKKEEP